ncbi:MAG: cell wall hydrolase [Pseudomonadota bacterium]
MYWEAKSEGPDGMLAVGQVVLNRVSHPEFPDTICGVVRQGGEQPPCQFSWWCDGKSDRPTEADAWSDATRIAEKVLRNPPSDRTRGALFFHNTAIDSPWTLKRTRTVQIGRHVFYR